MTEVKQAVDKEIHSNLPREGPGDNAATRRAFSMLIGLPSNPKLLDIGCGPGIQTIQLAQLTDGIITALDHEKKYLDELDKSAREQGVDGNIKTTQGSMFQLPFEAKSFDLIWSEGAIFIIGFEKGLREWRPLLKNGGLMAVTHLAWLKSDVPNEPKEFWQGAYPAITTIDENLKIVEQSGYTTLGHFVLPESAWWDEYYTPLEKRLAMLREKYKDNESALARIAESQQEIDVYRTYSDSYGYVFYIMQKS
ncbi:MAG: class I SAM-dependent methyltransferase [Nitrospira sp.]